MFTNAFVAVSLLFHVASSQLAAKAYQEPSELDLTYINECCRPNIRMNDQILYKCVNASAEQTIRDGWPLSGSKFAITSYATSSISGYAAFAFAVDQTYAEHNKYLFRIADPVTSNYDTNDARWNKIKILEKALETWAKDSDYIIWLDADLIILDLGMRLELITKEHPHGEIWVCASTEQSTNSNLMNSGFLILKNTDFVRSWLLKEWWIHDSRKDFNDQEIFDKIYMKYKTSKRLDMRVVVLEPDALNSDPPAAVRLKPKNQVMHLMGDHMTIRQKMFLTAFLEICKVAYDNRVVVLPHTPSLPNPTISSDDELVNEYDSEEGFANDEANQEKILEPLKPQLGLHPNVGLSVVLREYKQEYDKLKIAFKWRMTYPTQENSRGYNNFNEISHMNSCLRRYAEGLDHVEKTWSPRDIRALRTGSWTKLDQYLVETNSKLLDLIQPGTDGNSLPPSTKYSLLGAHPESADEIRENGYHLFLENLRVSEKVVGKTHDLQERAMIIYHVLESGSPVVKKRYLRQQDEKEMKSKATNKSKFRSDEEIQKENKDSEKIMKMLIKLGDELISIVEPSKRSYVHHIRTDLFTDYSMVKRSMGLEDESLALMKKGLKEKESEATYAGEHCLTKMLIIMGDRLCQVQRYEESLQYFNRAVKLQEEHMGPKHMYLGTYLFMSGQAHAAATHYREAIDIINRAIAVFEANPDEQSAIEKDLPRARWLIEHCRGKLGLNDQDVGDDLDEGKGSRSRKTTGKRMTKRAVGQEL